jgi:mannosyltransferase OCH1-like enzyme
MDYKLAAANMNNHYINPEYDYYFYDEADCVRFIKENYPQYIKHYNTLVPGAYKADLFRLLVLQKEGGVYIDDKTSCKIPLREIIQPEDELILVKDNLPGQIYQGVIFSTQGHFLLEKFIQRYIRNIESRYYGVDAYDIGGPKMFGRVLNTYLGQSEEYAFDSFTKDGIRVEGTTYYVMGQGNDSLALGVDIIASDKQVFWFERSNSAYISRKLKQALSGREYQTLWLLRKVYR